MYIESSKKYIVLHAQSESSFLNVVSQNIILSWFSILTIFSLNIAKTCIPILVHLFIAADKF